MSAPAALVIGGSRGLGRSLTLALLERGFDTYSTVRSAHTFPIPSSSASVSVGIIDQGKVGAKTPGQLSVITGIDLEKEQAGESIVKGLKGRQLDLVIFSAGYFQRDTIDKLDWDQSLKMMTICAVAPTFVAAALLSSNSFSASSKFLMITSEGGSIALRTKEEGGGNYAHHASVAAKNMIGRLLSLDLPSHGVTVVNIHPGFMRTEMTANVGYDEFWDSGGAVHPDVAAESILDFANQLKEDMNGGFWAPRGPRDVGQAESVMGKNLPTPLELPW